MNMRIERLFRRFQNEAREGEGSSGGEVPAGESGQGGESLLDGVGDGAGAGEGEGARTGEEGAAWYVAEGVPGQGEPPEWFNSAKYKTVADQAKAQRELEKKLGAFTGAPEGDYELNLPEGIQGEFDTEDPLLKGFMAEAKELGINQEAFDRLVGLYATQQAESMQRNMQQEIQALGDRAQARLKDIGDWGKANLTDDQFQELRNVASTAAGVQLLEALIGKSRSATTPRGDETAKTGVSPQKLNELRFATDENGNRKMAVDPDYRKYVESLEKEVYGEQPHQQIVG